MRKILNLIAKAVVAVSIILISALGAAIGGVKFPPYGSLIGFVGVFITALIIGKYAVGKTTVKSADTSQLNWAFGLRAFSVLALGFMDYLAYETLFVAPFTAHNEHKYCYGAGIALGNLAIAEETYFADHRAYTDSLKHLDGLLAEPDVVLQITKAGNTYFTATGYSKKCTRRGGEKNKYVWDSEHGGLQNK